jgi:hypothetical protein
MLKTKNLTPSQHVRFEAKSVQNYENQIIGFSFCYLIRMDPIFSFLISIQNFGGKNHQVRLNAQSLSHHVYSITVTIATL